MSKITEHKVYKTLLSLKNNVQFTVNMKESDYFCFVDAASSANQIEKRLFRHDHGTFRAVVLPGYESPYEFNPQGSYLQRRMIPFNLEYLQHNTFMGKAEVLSFFGKFFDERTQEFVRYLYERSNRWVSPNEETEEAARKQFTQQFTQEFKNNPNSREKTKMLDNVIKANKTAVAATANLVAARTVSNLVLSKVTPLLPEGVQAFANTPLGAVVLANMAVVLLDVGGDNLDNGTYRKLKSLSDAMLVSSMTSMVAQVDIAGMIQGVLATPGLEEYADFVDGEDQE